MDPEIKAQWIEALLSGKYRQGQRRLRKVVNGVVEHCCLGVLCEVEGLPHALVDPNDTVSYFKYGTEESTMDLPPKFRKVVGIEEQQQDHLTTMNDVQGYNFNQIAAWIKDNL